MQTSSITQQNHNFAEWYKDVISMSELAEHSPVRGCMTIKEYGYELWENIKSELDRRIKLTGHKNVYFPLLIPKSFLCNRKTFNPNFEKDLAMVTHAGGKKLDDPLVIRPTSEVLVGDSFSKWIKSYRDLPILINQWANVVRWTNRPRLFLRTSEFLWQEGHTAHESSQEAKDEVLKMLNEYEKFSTEILAIPVLKGQKSKYNTYIGAKKSYSINAIMKDKKSLECSTCYYLGTNFSKEFNIRFLDNSNSYNFCYTTSWGTGSRLIGAVIMVHGDDKGLRLPPMIAPIQVIIIPIFKNNLLKDKINKELISLAHDLDKLSVRYHIDDRQNITEGAKYNYWEKKGVPIRVEIGPKEIEKNKLKITRRDLEGENSKIFAKQTYFISNVKNLLKEIHNSMLAEATQFLKNNISTASNYEELIEQTKNGWAQIWFCNQPQCEKIIKLKTSSISFCINKKDTFGKCVCGRKTNLMAFFAKSY